MQQMMRQAQQMQERLQQEIAQIRVEASAGGGMVTVQMDGHKNPLGIKIDPEVAVILASGYSVEGEARSIINRGCQGFIQKPFQMQELSRKVREVLDGRGRRCAPDKK